MKKHTPIKTIIFTLFLTLFFTGCALVSEDQTNSNENENTNISVNQNVNENENTNTEEEVNQNTNQEAEIDTSDWLTYQNEEYGFSFKYPTKYSLKEYLNISNEKILDIVFEEEQGPFPSFWITEQSLEEVKYNIYNSDPVSIVKSEQEIIIEENQAIHILQQASIGADINYYIFQVNEKIYVFEELAAQHSGILNSILFF